MILRAISSNKELQTPTNLFLASLAVADLLVTLLLPMDAVSESSLGKLLSFCAQDENFCTNYIDLEESGHQAV